MQTLQRLEGLRRLPPGTVLSVGNFDGLHRGHHQLLEMAAAIKREGGASATAIVTFEPHPLTVLRPAPTPEVLNLTAEAFWAILRDEVRPAHLIEGRSFTFGKGRGGTIEKLRQWAAQSHVKLDILDPVSVPLLNLQVVEVSSSLIRWL